jgi:hypothetical protein
MRAPNEIVLALNRILRTGADPFQVALTNEEVFLSQLYRRSSLLNDGFQRQVLRVISWYEADQVELGAGQSEGQSPAEGRRSLARRAGSVTGMMPKQQMKSGSFSGSFTTATLVQDAGSGSLVGSVTTGPRPTADDDAWAFSLNEALSGQFAFPMRLHSVGTNSTDGTWSSVASSVVSCQCRFADGLGMVEVHQAPIKT